MTASTDWQTMVEPIEIDDDLVLFHWELATQMVAAWLVEEDVATLPILQLCGSKVTSKRAIAPPP